MSPNINIHEYLMREHQEALRREAEQDRWLAGRPHHWGLRHLIRRLGPLVGEIGTLTLSREQLDQPTGAGRHKKARPGRKDRRMNLNVQAQHPWRQMPTKRTSLSGAA